MKRTTVDLIVCLCLLGILYINLTDFPKQQPVVNGTLIKIGVE